MPQERNWPESDSDSYSAPDNAAPDRTEILPAVDAGSGGAKGSLFDEQAARRGGLFDEETVRHQQPIEQRTRYHAPVEQPTQVHRPAGPPSGPLPQQHSPFEQPTEQFGQRYAGGPARPGEHTTGAFAAVPPPHDGQPDAGQPAPGEPADGDDRKRRLIRRTAIIAGSALGALAALYALDLGLSQGSVPRGVTVAGVDVGGVDRAAAESQLRQQIEPRLTQPVKVKAGDVEQSIDPRTAGLTLDWSRTLDQAGEQPLNPIKRLTSFFTNEEVGVVTQSDPAKLASTMQDLRAKIDHDPVEGNIHFENTTPVPVKPRQGQQLNLATATEQVLAHWASGQPLDLPVSTTPVRTTEEGVRVALEQVAMPAMSGPVVVHGEGKDARLEPAAVAAALTFEPGDGGMLNPKLNEGKLVEAVGPQLKSTEKQGKDAEIKFEGGAPKVHPSEDGRMINWQQSFVPLLDTLKRPQDRQLTAKYENKPAKVTTDEANKLGIKEVIGEFSTGGFAPDSGANIRRVAEQVTGAIVKPGDTFSLNGHTGPRTAANGYVEAGIIENGQPGRAVGGGISQFATTMYNAYYFAGMKDAGHQEHSYYISRYPAGREATVFQTPNGASVIDLRFTNDAPTGVAIQAIWTPSSITVKLWGTKRFKVDSVSGERSNPIPPPTKPGPKDNCHPSTGAPGFTITDTRVLRDVGSGAEVRREPRTVRYDPSPTITCENKP